MKRTNARLLFSLLLLAGVAGCQHALRLEPSDAPTVLSQHTLSAADPSQPGEYAVERLYYGSGTDQRRAEYRDSVRITTESVDASKLVSLGESAKERNGYWGFKPDAFPVNGRVWYPVGDGPFPLVLIVHGNHNMREFSDPGYGYLGELLASRGMITVSVDENFLNGSIRGENDGRAWMLLKHLEAWRGFDADPENPFFGKVDLERVGLIGHSRGGEAVGHAAVFNRLSRYPDDANVEFDFNFGIRAVIAIAPVDGQYRPAGRLEPDLRDVSYLVFHGSHDGDVSSFMGLRQYQRVEYSEPEPTAGTIPPFKSAVYVYRANHGQWNTVWGSTDSGGKRGGRILDLRGLLDPEDQRTFGKLYISAFLETTLKDDPGYLSLFRDHRVAGNWLPETMYITRFRDGSFRPVADFSEDVDVTTGTVSGTTIVADSLAVWKEGELILRVANSAAEGSSLQEWAVTLGWNREIEGDTTRLGSAPSYTVTLPDSLADSWGVDDRLSISFLLGATPDEPGPRKPEASDSSAANGNRADRDSADEADEQPKPPLDLSVELVDRSGQAARLPLSLYGAIRRPLETYVLRRADREESRFANPWDLVLQSYDLPIADFRAVNPALAVDGLSQIRFVFDRSTKGTVVIDDVGIARMDPRFWSATVGEGARQ